MALRIGTKRVFGTRERKSSGDLITSQDVIYEILLRLPATSIMCFKRACKHWNSIISDDPVFAELHAKTSIQKLTLLFQKKTEPDHFGFCRLTPEFWICKSQENKIEKSILPRLPFRSLGSSGALLLFDVRDANSKVPILFVHDCTNGKQIELAGLPEDFSFIWRRALLVYDAYKNIHKVLVYSCTNRCYITSFNTRTLAKENGWRTKPSPLKTLIWSLGYQAINGVLYWLVFGVGINDVVLGKERDNRTFIQPFDIVKEEFLNTISCPNERFFHYQSAFHTYHLLQLRESLGLMRIAGLELRIWVLKDSSNSSWIQLHNISLHVIFDIPIPKEFELRPVFVLEHLRRLPSILLELEKKYYWYEIDGKNVKEIDVQQQPTYGRFLTAWFN